MSFCSCGQHAGPTGLCSDCFLERDASEGSLARPAGLAWAVSTGSAIERKMQIIRLREKQLADWKAHADRMEDALTKIHTILGQHYGLDANGVEVECYEIANAALSLNVEISHDSECKGTP